MDLIRVYRIPFSTNVERVALAAAYKGVELDWIDVDPDDRSPVVAASGQELVPVLDADGEIVVDSTAILDWLEAHHPEPPLYPRERARRAEVRVFVEWFNEVWKRPPNLIAAEPQRAAELGPRMRGWLDVFESLLDGRDFLFGELGAADMIAFPFLKYPVLGLAPDDDDPFHRVLVEELPLDGAYPRLDAWVRRLDRRPRA